MLCCNEYSIKKQIEYESNNTQVLRFIIFPNIRSASIKRK